MDVVHPRCAGIDISKKDAKVCVRLQGRGSRGTATTVTTWGAMTGQILALREHLVAQHVTCVVMEATGDYWKPYFYLLEDAVPVMLPGICRAARPMSPMPPGWPTSVPTDCSVARSSRRNRSADCAISLGPAPH